MDLGVDPTDTCSDDLVTCGRVVFVLTVFVVNEIQTSHQNNIMSSIVLQKFSSWMLVSGDCHRHGNSKHLGYDRVLVDMS